MKTSIPGEILLFGGQGSKGHMSDTEKVAELEDHLREAKPLFKPFLQQCFDAFHSECDSLNEEEGSILGCDSSLFYQDAEALLFPARAVQSHPITETISLYLRQILELIVLSAQSEVYPRVVEVTGVCTGLIPAVLAASTFSYESEGFFNSALHGFRLAFWIGLRAASARHDVLDDQEPGSARVLSIFGWSTNELETALSKYHGLSQEQSSISMRISTILNNDVHSLSGPGNILNDFQTTSIPPHISCRAAHVHGFYHGGSQMDPVVNRIMNDAKTRRIHFPTWDTLQAPLRSSITGARMMKGSSCQSLLETVLRDIFVDVCDWKTTRKNLYDETIKHLEHDSKARFRVLCVGPGTRSLVHGMPTHDRLNIIYDVSNFQQDNMDDMIAIVGMSVNYPGANGKEQLWEMLENARSTASKIPPSRFDVSAMLGDRLGHFLDDPFQFDAAFFNISPREANSMDPQQRLLLQAALQALEDSGYTPNSTLTFQEESFGVFVGVATNDYVDNLRQNIDVYYSPGTLKAFLSGRLSYAFNFLGPSIVVDTACSSSLLALHQACQAIQSGDCTAALAGGVNIISSPDMYNGLARAHFLSPSGQCKPFDARADGYSRAEGCGLVVVKKLSSAIEENDKIYGIIRGIGANQCGTAKSITHPDHATQAALFKQVLNSSRTAPDTIDVVEAHGTGTQAGDYAEVSSLRKTFLPRSESHPLYISSIKGNFGHAEAASGLAGLGKLLVMLEKGKIPPHASFEKLNPCLADCIGNMTIPTRLIEWKRPSNRSSRRAMLNNFGAAGSNVALILEEYVPKQKASSDTDRLVSDRSSYALSLSAKSERALQLLKKDYIAYLEAHPDTEVKDLCYTTNARKQAHANFRLSAIGSHPSQLVHSLRQSECIQPNCSKIGPRRSIFVFSGQGHAHAGMGSELLSTVPYFRRVVEMCDKTLFGNGFPIVSPFLSNSSDLDVGHDAKTEVLVTQCALFVLEFALAQTWMQWGLTPDVVIGHSIGEYAAMAIAGMLDVKDALLLVARRAQLIGTKCMPGMAGMVTCRGTVEEIGSVLAQDDSQFSGLGIACLNGREDIVVAGPVKSLTHFTEFAQGKGIKAKQLKVPYGFHSSCMDPILEDLKSCASAVTLRQASVAVGSSLQGKLLSLNEEVRPDYFVRHTRDPVNFYRVIEDLERSFPDTALDFIEIGPFPSTESMVRKAIKTAHCTFMPSLKPTENSWETLSHSLSSLFLRSYPVKWREVYDGSSAKLLTSVPKYPLHTSQYYVRYQNQPHNKIKSTPEVPRPSFEYLGSAKPNISGCIASFHTNLAPLAPHITAHTVAGVPLCPASVLIEVLLEALSVHCGPSRTALHLLEDVAFEKPLLYTDQIANQYNLKTTLDTSFKDKTRFSLSSNSRLHCSGLVGRKLPSDIVDILTRKSALVNRQRSTIFANLEETFDSFSPKTIYNVIFPRVVTYAEPFLTLKQLSVSESRLEGCGRLQLDGALLEKRFVCHPAFLDTLLHAPGFIANMYVPADIAGICVGMERAHLPSAQDMKEGEMMIFCSLTDLGHSVVADAYVIDSNEKIMAYVEGARFKKIPLKSFQNHLSRAVQTAGCSPPPTQAPSPLPKNAPNPSPSHVEEIIQSAIQECCGVAPDQSSSTTLVEAGIDSLMLIEITRSIRRQFPQIELDVARLESCSTLEELTAAVSGASPPNLPGSDLTRKGSPKSQDATVPSTPASNHVVSPIKTLLADICGIKIETNMMDKELGTLGVDSLLSIELIDELRERCGFVIDSSQHNIPELTVNGLEEIFCEGRSISDDSSRSLDSLDKTDAPSAPGSPMTDTEISSPWRDYDFQMTIQRQSHGPQTPTVYLFHDGSGYCNMYSRMSNINRNIVGIYSPDQFTDIKSLEDLARFYIDRTRLKHEQALVLGGWSFGGVLAFEVARQLQSLGRAVRGLILIDSPLPVAHKALPQEIISYVAGKIATGGTTRVTEAVNQARDRVNQRFQYHAALLQDYRAEPQYGEVPCVILKCSRSIDTEALCNVSYLWLSDDDFRTKSAAQWKHLIGRDIPVLDIACNHFEVFDAEYVGDVSRNVMHACEMLD